MNHSNLKNGATLCTIGFLVLMKSRNFPFTDHGDFYSLSILPLFCRVIMKTTSKKNLLQDLRKEL